MPEFGLDAERLALDDSTEGHGSVDGRRGDVLVGKLGGASQGLEDIGLNLCVWNYLLLLAEAEPEQSRA